MKPKRPFLLWLLAILGIVACFIYFLQAVQAIRSWNLLVILQYRFGSLYPIFQGLFLGTAFFAAAVLLIVQKSWAPTFAAATLCLADAWSWVNRLWLNLNPGPLSRQYFAIGATVVLLGLLLGGLWTLQPFMIDASQDASEESSHLSSDGGTNEQQ
jgi:hypothetical protein